MKLSTKTHGFPKTPLWTAPDSSYTDLTDAAEHKENNITRWHTFSEPVS